MSLNAENVTQRPISRTSGAGSEKTFEAKFFTLTVEEAAKQPPGKEYDIIIVGSGIGGGVLAHDLYDTNIKLGNKAKRVLLLEKGGVVFHSHSKRHVFQRFKDDYVFSPPLTQKEWKGGPMYNLGGRSAAWGLFAPRIHDSVLKNHFHPQVTRELQWNYYDKAERLMLLSIPTTRRIHQRIMDRLNLDGLEAEKDSNIQWKWGRIASEFQEEKNFDFAEGAYSSIDKILEIAMSRPQKQDANGAQIPVEHEYFKTVLNADVRSLNFDKDKNVTGVNVRTACGGVVPINVRQGGNVVLSAGSVHSPAILLRSGDSDWQSRIRDHGGLRLTDHDILSYSCSFRYSDPDHRSEYGAMKLQTYVEIGDHIALANMSIDASSFLPRSNTPDNDLPQFFMVFILQRPLVEQNNISIKGDEPEVKLERGARPTESQLKTMRNVTATAMRSLSATANLKFVGFEDKQITWKDIQLSELPLGGVAHELGTLPMDNGHSDHPSCLDPNLRIQPEICNGVYVCDLSCLPYSPESNPTLTLAALAIRLSRHLNARSRIECLAKDVVHVVNHSGSQVKVWLSNYQPNGEAASTDQAVILDPGSDKSWKRESCISQALFVFKPNRDKKDGSFVDAPVILLAHPGKVTPIHPLE
ncbi:GMC oxidoreductase [Rhizoctonia solani]|uniref:GMC oxidoreductase n=1 Tax=Rhizoctonia solani TaxID=456999 RepID=A0A8H8SZT8_9AGAM|nr:GMC oxidoreductase [Rhizoctonia solani]QRW23784.1 GMC oxidoreductase [Rhizoctonia solani]